jgi:hypothetical protein
MVSAISPSEHLFLFSLSSLFTNYEEMGDKREETKP